MARIDALCLLAALSISLSLAPAQDDERVERVEVGLSQIDITAWSKDGDSNQCRGLTADDFLLRVDGRLTDIVAVDSAGTFVGEIRNGETESSSLKPPEDPLTLVLLFDHFHLGLFRPICGSTLPLAIESSRQMIENHFREGDRLLIVEYTGWPQASTDWADTRVAALRSLELVEDRIARRAETIVHSHHQNWVENLETLARSLGDIPGRKEVLYLGDDFYPDTLDRIDEFVAHSHAARVSWNAVDLISLCRESLRGSVFARPNGIALLASNTGGQLHRTSSIADAVISLREAQGCRYTISFKARPKRARTIKQNVRVSTTRDDVLLRYPFSVLHPNIEPSAEKKAHAVFVQPRLSRGFEADAQLTLIEPNTSKSWKALLTTRVRPQVEELEHSDIERLEITAQAVEGSRIRGRFVKTFEGHELEKFLSDPEGGKFDMYVDVTKGINTVMVTARDPDIEFAANARAELIVPSAPAPDEAPIWLLAERVKTTDSGTLVPVPLTEILPTPESPMIFGFACIAEGHDARFRQGTLVSPDGNSTRPVPLRWASEPTSAKWVVKRHRKGAKCGWMVGKIHVEHLTTGIWRFEPPGTDEEAVSHSILPIEFVVKKRNADAEPAADDSMGTVRK